MVDFDKLRARFNVGLNRTANTYAGALDKTTAQVETVREQRRKALKEHHKLHRHAKKALHGHAKKAHRKAVRDYGKTITIRLR